MKHTDFINELSRLGLSFSSTIKENEPKTIEIPNLLTKPDIVNIENLECSYIRKNNSDLSALEAVIQKAIDLDSFKHSWNNEIEPQSYEYFKEIIQKKIIERAKDIDFLFTAYLLLNKETNNLEENE